MFRTKEGGGNADRGCNEEGGKRALASLKDGLSKAIEKTGDSLKELVSQRASPRRGGASFRKKRGGGGAFFMENTRSTRRTEIKGKGLEMVAESRQYIGKARGRKK